MNCKIYKKQIVLLVVLIWTVSFLPAFAADGSLPQRADIEDKYKWRVEDIYETEADWNTDFALLDSSIDEFDKYVGHLGDSPDMLYNCLKL
ncbi:MAG: hypothetical protein KAR42_03955, partial [candidate division Zixibacteria bacterium]|nr:hypothetical protein [candidate division Zixibacteria bacterium]